MSVSRRKFLTIITLLLVMVGVAMASIPFGLSLFPSERADAALSRINITELRPGSFKLVTPDNAYELYNGFKRSVYILKTNTGEIRAWAVYAKNGEVGMPDYHWWNVYFTCKHFSPAINNGIIEENSLIQCRDKDISPWQSENWRWRQDGKSITQNVDDMRPAHGMVEGDYFVVGKVR